MSTSQWPRTAEDLIALQRRLATAEPPPWQPHTARPVVGGCFACFPRGTAGPGAAGDPLWAAAAVFHGRRCTGRVTTTGEAGAEYQPGLFALRVGSVLEAVVRRLPEQPEVVLVDATGYDHPRRFGLARHLGAVLGLPTIGITHRTLLAVGEWPPDERAAATPLTVAGETVGYWVRTRTGRRPLAVHAAWRTDAATAVDIVLGVAWKRTPAPLRESRRLAREARTRATRD